MKIEAIKPGPKPKKKMVLLMKEEEITRIHQVINLN